MQILLNPEHAEAISIFFSWKTGSLGEKELPKVPKPESSKVEI